MNITTITIAAVCVSVLALSVRQIRPDMAQLISIGAAVVLLAAVIPYAAEVIEAVKEFSSYCGEGSKYIEPVLKITGIAYITQLGAELCSDAGENALAGRVEMAGKIAICVITIPIAKEAFIKIIGIIR